MLTFATTGFMSGASEAASIAAMGPSGVGAAAGAGASTGAFGAIASAVPYFQVFGMVVGAGLGAMASNEHNRALRQQTKNAYEQINSQIGEQRLSYLDQTQRAAFGAYDTNASVQLQLSAFGSGLSANEYISQLHASQEYDQTLRTHEQDLVEKGLLINKENVYAQAKGSYENPIIGALQGASTYGAAAGALGSTVDTLRINTANSQALNQFMQEYDNNPSDPLNIARGQAIAAGIPAYRLQQGGTSNVFLQPFLSGLKQTGLQTATLQNEANLTSAMNQVFNFTHQRELNSAYQFGQQYGPYRSPWDTSPIGGAYDFMNRMNSRR